MSEENNTKPEKKKKPNPFLEKLKDNQVAQARSALLATICENPSQTIGSILDALEEDADGDYIMLEIFKRMTLEDLVKASTPNASTPAASASDDEEDEEDEEELEEEEVEEEEADEEEEEDELEDDDEFDDDDEDLEDEEEAHKPPKKGKGKGKKKKSKDKNKDKGKSKGKGKKKKSKNKSKDKDKGSSGGTVNGKAVLSCLRAKKARDADSALSSKEIRDEIGGNADELRPILNSLYEADKIDKCGEARGTKYFLV